jgi:ornithine cyclodeaminase
MLILEIEDIKKIVQIHGYKNFFLELLNILEEDYSSWDSFDKSARLANHVKDGVIELMPISNNKFYSFKYVNGHPKNPLNNKFTVMATGQLSLVKTGEPLMFSEMTLLTALRTATTSLLAAKYLAKKESKVLTLIGTGAQSEFQYLAFSFYFDIKEVRFYDIDPNAMKKFHKNISSYDVKLSPCKSSAEAIKNADIITTITADKSNQIILDSKMVKEPVFINAIGGDCPGKTELSFDLLKKSTIVVEYLAQSKIEGEIQQFDDNFTCTQLYEVINKQKSINVTTDGIVVFDSVGFALEDYSILRFIYQLAIKYSIGKEMSLIPDIKDVKDLFSLIKE